MSLLIGVSGFVFGDPTGVAVWGIALIACIAAPVLGFVLRSFGKPGIGTLVAWLPPAVGLFRIIAPVHSY